MKRAETWQSSRRAITRGRARRSAQVTLSHTGRGCGGCEEERDVTMAHLHQGRSCAGQTGAVAARLRIQQLQIAALSFLESCGCFKSLKSGFAVIAARCITRRQKRTGRQISQELSKRVRGSRRYHLKGATRLLVDQGESASLARCCHCHSRFSYLDNGKS